MRVIPTGVDVGALQALAPRDLRAAHGWPADTIIVAGHVKGKMTASTRIVLRETASVEGEAAAPSVSIAEGAVVHGRIETAKKRALALAS